MSPLNRDCAKGAIGGAASAIAAPLIRDGLYAGSQTVISILSSGTGANEGGSTGSNLENAGQAVIDPQKVTGYALDPTHPVGGNKAIVFDSALGFNQSNADQLISQIQKGVTENPAIPGKSDQFGQRFTVDMPITGPNGNTVTVRSGWIYDPGSSTPRLTTLYVK